MRLTKGLRELTPIAAQYNLRFDGCTSKGHYRWVHVPTGRVVVTIRDLTSYRSIKNTERQIKRFIREVSDGQYDRPN